MGAILYLAASALGGWLGWELGAPLGGAVAFVASLVGTALGVYAARRVTRYFRG